MGTLVTITLYAPSSEKARQAFSAAFARIRDLDESLSDYKPESELSRACSLQSPVSRDLSYIVRHAQKLARETDGAFDITAGPLTRLWRAARKQNRLPDESAIQEGLRRTGYRKLSLTNGRIQCEFDGMQLDSGGIAKGYAADEALAAISRNGISAALVAMSGDIAAGAPPPGKPGWRVRVQDQVVPLAHSAVSTSGDEFQFLEIDGVRYSHIIDPRTGMPVLNRQSVSVIARTGIAADAMATALSVSGCSTQRIVDLRSSRSCAVHSPKR